MPPETPETLAPPRTERPLTAQRLAQYVARGRCERHLRFALFPTEAAELLGRYGLEIEPLSPLLSGAGQSYEREMVGRLRARGADVRDVQRLAPEEFARGLREETQARVLYYQRNLPRRSGGWECEGCADLI